MIIPKNSICVGALKIFSENSTSTMYFVSTWRPHLKKRRTKLKFIESEIVRYLEK